MPPKKTYKVIVICTLILSWVLEIYCRYNNQRGLLLLFRILNIILISLYYFISVEKINYTFSFFLLVLLLIGGVFAFDDYSPLAMLLVSISRVLLIGTLCSFKQKIDKKLLIKIGIVLTVAISIIVYVLYQPTRFYYLATLATYFLIIILAMTFTRLLIFGVKKGNLELFLAAFLFLLSDAFFGSRKLSETYSIYIALSSSMYLIAYFLITQAMIKRDSTINQSQY